MTVSNKLLFLASQTVSDPEEHVTGSDLSTGLSRRQFLARGLVAVGAAASGGAIASPIVTTPMTVSVSKVPSQPAIVASSCSTATIPTRLFASSNVGQDESRNQLSLQRLSCAGFDVQNPEITRRQYLRFAGTDFQRASDLQNIATGAVVAPKLLLGVRGGYGAMRLLPMVDWATLGRVMKERGTIMAGFSDVTAVQCALLAKGQMSSLAAPMLYSEFGKAKPDQVSCQNFVEALTNANLRIDINQSDAALKHTHVNMLAGKLTGTLWGGNLSVVSALAGSDYLPHPDGGIVFLEDVGEQPYQIERMLYSLYLAGAFKNQQAILLGAFSGTGQDSYDARYDMVKVIAQLQQITGLPVLTGVPFGHVARKYSFPLGSTCTLTAIDSGFSMLFNDYPTIQADRIQTEALWQ